MLDAIIQFILIPFVFIAGLIFPAAEPPVQVINTVDLSEITQIESRIEGVEQELNSLGASLAIPTPVALFEDALASGINTSATSFTLLTGTDITGTALASSTYGFIIDEGTASEEFVLADCTSTACTNVTRGLSPITGTSTVAILQKSHRRGATVKITDGPIILILKGIINGQAPFPNALTFDAAFDGFGVSQNSSTGLLTYDTALTFSAGSNQIITATYADNIANQGAASSTEAIAGIAEAATALETASSTPFGVDEFHYINSENATSTRAYSCDSSGVLGALCVVVGQNDGKLDQTWLRLTDTFAFTDTVSIAKQLTVTKTIIGGFDTPSFGAAATTTIDWDAGNTHYVTMTGNTAIQFSNQATSTAIRLFLCQDGTGSRLVTNWPMTPTTTEMRWAGGFEPTLTTGANKCDVISFFTATTSDAVFGAASLNY